MWYLRKYLSLHHLSHLVQMEFIRIYTHICLRNVQSAYVCMPLCMLHNQSLQCGLLPQDWKCANITPVFKKGIKSEATKYQPLSLTLQIIITS